MSDAVDEGVRRDARFCTQCREDGRPVYASGLCQRCYGRWYYLKNWASDKYKAMVDGGFDRNTLTKKRGGGAKGPR